MTRAGAGASRPPLRKCKIARSFRGSSQSPRRALVCLIIPVHGAGLARARVRMASWEAEPPISAPRARLPDYSRTMVPVARAYARVSELETISPQSPRRALVCLIIPVHGAGLARARVRMASWEADLPISAPHARLPDYPRI